jgi:cytoskeletal protein CcmA (bactofilin family)
MANTVIGSSIVIDGEISGDEDLVIQGTVKGKIPHRRLDGAANRRSVSR